MGKDLKDTWKETGKGIGFAFRDLGKAIIKTGATALNKANEWANSEDGEEQEKKAQDDKKS
jgi:hypothetical protein